MKKLLLLLLFVPISLISQTFEVTPNGLRDSNDLDKSYLVLSFEGKTAKELYEKAYRYMNERQDNPDASTRSNIENEYLRYKTMVSNAIKYKNGFQPIVINIQYQVDMKFRDGRIRLEFIDIKMPAKDYKYSLNFSGGKLDGYIVFDKKGKLYKKQTKEDLEIFFNSRVKDLYDFINKTEEDW